MIISLVSMNTWLKKRVVNPLQRLRDTAGSFVESSHHAESPDDLVITDPEIHTEDEMEALSNSITEMFEDMKHYMTDLVYVTKEKERIGAELNVATQIQADMLPNIFPAFPERDDLNIYASMTPAKEVGGDFYDFFFVDPDHLAIVMADVSGKGVPAALFMVIAKTLIKSVFQSGGGAGDSLADVNNRLCEGNEAGLFVTVWMAVIDLKTGEGVSLNAGHEHPALCKAGGDYELVVYKHSVAVAAMEDMIFRERRFKMDKGDKLFVYTDGVAEATNADNELFGTDRMIETLNKNKDKTLKEQVDGMKESIDEFVQDAPQFDDITMLCFEYKGQPE
jgi:sigma-B regulation protein RsbU (phosphoserine phosphatase)